MCLFYVNFFLGNLWCVVYFVFMLNERFIKIIDDDYYGKDLKVSIENYLLVIMWLLWGVFLWSIFVIILRFRESMKKN